MSHKLDLQILLSRACLRHTFGTSNSYSLLMNSGRHCNIDLGVSWDVSTLIHYIEQNTAHVGRAKG